MINRHILICDDHAFVREAISDILGQSFAGSRIDQAEDYEQAWAMVSRMVPDLILCDLAMPGSDPRAGIRELLRLAPSTPVCVLTGSQDQAMMVDLLADGVSGFVGKFSSGSVIVAAINLILAGGRYIPPEVLDLLNSDVQIEKSPDSNVRLTAQQVRVLALVAQGKSNKMIALELAVAPSTVKTHLEQAMRSIGAKNRYEAAQLAQQQGLI